MKVEIQIRQTPAGGYVARCSAMPGCVAAGGSPQQARERMAQQVRWYLASFDAACPEHLEVVVCGPAEPPLVSAAVPPPPLCAVQVPSAAEDLGEPS